MINSLASLDFSHESFKLYYIALLGKIDHLFQRVTKINTLVVLMPW